MDKLDKQYRQCGRCQELNELKQNFCWQCGLDFFPEARATKGRAGRAGKIAAGVGLGIGGVLAGALGGVIVGILIVIAMILSFLNGIAEIFEGCAATLLFVSLFFSTVIYSLVTMFF